MIGVNTSIFKSAGRKLVSLLGALKDRATYYENGTDSVAEKNHIDDLGILDKATILLTPTATSDARVHSVKTYTGDELVTNGTFDTDLSSWTNTNTHWQWSSGSAYHPLTTSFNPLKQDITNNVGAVLRITFDLTYVQGTAQCFYKNEANSDVSTAFTSSGSYTIITEPVKANTEINFARSLGHNTEFYIDNVSVVDVSSDFAFDRASSATRINSSGLVQDMQSITDPELVLNGDFEELGNNVLIGDNSTFDSGVGNWTTYTNGIIAHDADKLEVTLVSGGGARINTSSLFTGGQVGKTLKIRARIWQGTTTRSNIAIYVGSVQETVNISSTPTYFEVYLKPTSTGYLTIYSSSDNGTFFIDDVSVQQVDPNDRWSTETGWSIENGKLKGLNVGEDLYAFQTVTALENTGLHKVEYTISGYGRGSVRVGLGTGLVNEGTKNQADGTYTEYIQFSNGLGDKFVGFEAFENFTGSIDNVSVKHVTFEEDNVDLARINYDSNGDNGHILLEPTSTNFVTYSEDFSQWTKSSGGTGSAPVITLNNSISPDGTQNADKIVFDKGTGTSVSDYSVLTTSFTSQSNTASIYIKADSPQRIVIRNSSTWEGYDIGTDWTRIEKTDTGGSIQIGLRDGYGVANVPNTATVYLWGAQVENLPYATSYIPTLTGSSVTRATETLTGSGNSTLINSTEGVLYAEIAKVQDDPDNYRLISLNNAASNSDATSVTLGFESGGDDFYIRIKSGGVVKLLSYAQSATANAFHKIAIRYKSGDSAFFINGTKLTSYNTGDGTVTFTFPVALDNLSFDFNGNGTLPFYGKCKALAVFNEALTDDELELLTGVTNYGSFGELASANGYTII